MPEMPSYFLLAFPELLSLLGLAVVGIAGIQSWMSGSEGGSERRRGGWLHLIGLLLLLAAILFLPVQSGLLKDAAPFGSFRFFPLVSGAKGGGLLILDRSAIVSRGGIALFALVAVIAGGWSNPADRTQSSRRFLAGLFGVVFAAFLLAGANDLLIVWGGIELLALAASVAARGDGVSERRHYRFGFFFSALSLFGILLFYGIFGTTELFGIAATLSARNVETVPANGLLIASLFLLVGSVARIGMALAEVVRGSRVSSLSFASLFALIAVAGYALFTRLVVGVFPADIRGIEIGVLTVVFGSLIGIVCAFLAAGADSPYRILCYAAGAHLGVALLPLSSRSAFGFTAGTVYLAVHLALTLAAVLGIGRMKRRGEEGGRHLREVFRSKRGGDLFTGILLLALAGFPFTGGFLSRFFLLDSLLEPGAPSLAALLSGVAVSILLLYAYGRALYALYFSALQENVVRGKREHPATIRERLADSVPGLCGVLVIVCGFPGGFRLLWNLLRSWLTGAGG